MHLRTLFLNFPFSIGCLRVTWLWTFPSTVRCLRVMLDFFFQALKALYWRCRRVIEDTGPIITVADRKLNQYIRGSTSQLAILPTRGYNKRNRTKLQSIQIQRTFWNRTYWIFKNTWICGFIIITQNNIWCYKTNYIKQLCRF